jgi:hypothetical protein
LREQAVICWVASHHGSRFTSTRISKGSRSTLRSARRPHTHRAATSLASRCDVFRTRLRAPSVLSWQVLSLACVANTQACTHTPSHARHAAPRCALPRRATQRHATLKPRHAAPRTRVRPWPCR